MQPENQDETSANNEENNNLELSDLLSNEELLFEGNEGNAENSELQPNCDLVNPMDQFGGADNPFLNVNEDEVLILTDII